MSKVVTVKIIVIGESGVGKSSLILRFVKGSFNEDLESTRGIDFSTKTMKIKEKKVQIEIWDSAKLQKFKSVPPNFYRNAHGAILVYDVQCKETFNQLEQMLCDLHKYSVGKVVTMIVGNKNDLKREVSRSEGEIFANSKNALFIETSAKYGNYVEDAFMNLIKEILETSDHVLPHEGISLEGQNVENATTSKCC